MKYAYQLAEVRTVIDFDFFVIIETAYELKLK